MKTLWLLMRAPFAAFRGFQAGVYRATSPVMPPSAAFGLVLNLAGIEMRAPVSGLTTLIRDDVPKLRIAVGIVSPAERGSLYQQLHSYPVGNSGKELLAARTHGAKYWIVPVRRELLIGFDAIIGVQSEEDGLFDRVRRGLSGELDEPRYGLPFAGDNNFLFDRIDVVDEPSTPTFWYTRIQPNDPPRKGSCRLTVGINRADNSKTSSFLYAPLEEALSSPPDTAWTWTPHPPDGM
jgi:CRISPR-associated protein Cas5t